MNAIPYRPELRQTAGSITAAILLQQMLYWREKSGDKPFYKFKQPCQHPAYKAGDSWCEELGFTRSEFDTALKHLVSRGLVSKQVTRDRLTIYTVNESALVAAGKPVYLKRERVSSKSGNPTFDITETKTGNYQETTNNILEPDLPKQLQAGKKIVCDVDDNFVEKPEAVSSEAYRNLSPALKTLPAKQALQVLELIALAVKEGSIKTTQERMGGALIKAARSGTLDTSRIIQAEQAAESKRRAERAEVERAKREKAGEIAHLAMLAKLGGVSVETLMRAQ